jgi:hypothetical protein
MIEKKVKCDMCGEDCEEYFVLELYGYNSEFVETDFELCKKCKDKVRKMMK